MAISLFGGASAKKPEPAGDLIKETTTQTFVADVIEASRKVPMLEAINMCEAIACRKLDWTYTEQGRIGDHIWYISNVTKFKKHYPRWSQRYNVQKLLTEIYELNVDRWTTTPSISLT